jgi:hypothetical protein
MAAGRAPGKLDLPTRRPPFSGVTGALRREPPSDIRPVRRQGADGRFSAARDRFFSKGRFKKCFVRSFDRRSIVVETDEWSRIGPVPSRWRQCIFALSRAALGVSSARRNDD